MYVLQLGMGRSCVGLQTGVVLLLLLLRQSVAMAPGDEDERCPVPEYSSVRVKVLMDSWRYQTLVCWERMGTVSGLLIPYSGKFSRGAKFCVFRGSVSFREN